MQCEERSGFLFAHDCDRVGLNACMKCQKTVCEMHSRESGSETVCITCFKESKSMGKAGARSRDHHHDPFLYHAGLYYTYGYYDVHDYETFSHSGVEGGDFEGDPFDS